MDTPAFLKAQILFSEIQRAALIFVLYFLAYVQKVENKDLEALIPLLESGEIKSSGQVYRRVLRLSRDPSQESYFLVRETLLDFQKELLANNYTDPKLLSALTRLLALL